MNKARFFHNQDVSQRRRLRRPPANRLWAFFLAALIMLSGCVQPAPAPLDPTSTPSVQASFDTPNAPAPEPTQTPNAAPGQATTPTF